jgi:hypothetical protein
MHYRKVVVAAMVAMSLAACTDSPTEPPTRMRRLADELPAGTTYFSETMDDGKVISGSLVNEYGVVTIYSSHPETGEPIIIGGESLEAMAIDGGDGGTVGGDGGGRCCQQQWDEYMNQLGMLAIATGNAANACFGTIKNAAMCSSLSALVVLQGQRLRWAYSNYMSCKRQAIMSYTCQFILGIALHSKQFGWGFA